MLYAWIDKNGTLCTTFELESVPSEYLDRVCIFENLSIHDHDKLYVEDGKIKIKTEEMILQEKRQELLTQLKQTIYNLLLPTDWVIVKCTELGIQPSDSPYSSILEKRKKLRQLGDELEREIMQAKTLSELENIQLKINNLGVETA